MVASGGKAGGKPFSKMRFSKRVTGFEPATFSLGS